MQNVIRSLIDYNVWATRRLLSACASLTEDQLQRDFGTADRSISGTMLHLFRSERIWLQRIRGEAQTYIVPGDDFRRVAEDWSTLHDAWRQSVAAAQLDSVLTYHDLKGVERSNILWQTLVHVVNHCTHHRGQVSGFLRASGITPPSLDYITYIREQSQP